MFAFLGCESTLRIEEGDVPERADTADTDSVDTADEDADTAEDTDTGGGPDPWEDFVAARDGWLVELGEPVLFCTGETDSAWPLFHGCYDWHSAVHGVYALHALHRLTGDPTWLDAAEALISDEAVQAELDGLLTGRLDSENPYGFAWFLALARERELTTGEADLAPMAAEIADRLEAWVDALPPRGIEATVLADDYQNLSWALYNLHRQALWDGDTERAARVEAHVRDGLLPVECPLEDDAQAAEFFPPCLHRARAIVEVLPPDEAAAWMEQALPETLALEPRTRFASAHQAGQNFSRAWGLWALWAASGDPQYRAAYADHVATHVGLPDYWAEGYLDHAHWVPQFGVYAIAEGWEE